MKREDLKHIYPKDIRCMGIIARSGSMGRSTFHKLEISDNRILGYQKAGLIRQVSVVDRHGGGIKTYFELTPAGRVFCRDRCAVSSFISNGNASEHNARVSEYIADSLTKREIDTILCERELQPLIEDRLNEYWDRREYDRYQELLDAVQNHTLSMPDIVYRTEQGVCTAIEVVTDNYGNAEIEAKQEFCELMGMEIVMVHT